MASLAFGCDLAPDPPSGDPPEVVRTDPADGAVDVPRRGPFLVEVDDRLFPPSVSRATVRVESGAVAAFLSVRFDPVDSTIVATPFFDQPLSTSVTWRLVVEGVRNLDGETMEGTHVTTFRTGEALGDPYVPESAGWADVEPIFTGACTGATCHGPGEAALSLDLSSAEGVRETAIGVVSREFPAGTAAVEGARGAITLAALPIVDVVAGAGRPATSYLLYKVLDDPHIFGDPMPPPGHPPLTPEQIRALAAWILAGAPTE